MFIEVENNSGAKILLNVDHIVNIVSQGLKHEKIIDEETEEEVTVQVEGGTVFAMINGHTQKAEGRLEEWIETLKTMELVQEQM